ncbi:hypothetical protein RCL1_003502 [Eukaryota sp. TZLM3-RCL]
MFVQLLLVLFLVVQVYCGCVCADRSCLKYDKKAKDCHCFCQTTLKDVIGDSSRVDPKATCGFVPKSSSSPGSCALCSHLITYTPHLSIPGDHFTLAVLSQGDYLFPLRACICVEPNCKHFRGTSEACFAWASSKKSLFVGPVEVTYFPYISPQAAGNCVVCGLQDPCL